MVCSIGSGRMAVMARLLEAGSISPNVAEEVGNKKLAAQYIYRELRGADEANLLDEEDMHVFGLKPMADPLNLVCCNACKKPVKASQYAAHAELCRSLKTTEDTILELDVSTGHRKPPRKERKKSLAAYANQPTPVGEQERSEVIDADDPIASESHMDGQIRMTSSLTIDAKRNSSCVDTTYVMDGSGANLQNADHSTSVVPPSTKRFKLIVGCLPLPDDPNTASGVTEILDTHGLYSSRDSPVETVSDTETANDRQVHEHCLLTKDQIFQFLLVAKSITLKEAAVFVQRLVISTLSHQPKNFAVTLLVGKNHSKTRYCHRLHPRGTVLSNRWIICLSRSKTLLCRNLIKFLVNVQKYV
ncbi:uncharacterized protein LOC111292580 isoform X10 [Durio zibethinus]|uniref:Uncharacterized protein LOC111292580 isoform X10 n=1 Tax=Durio zibethinus TaxID=66656 RepID=A0A6P5YKG3_DURZI|nr:uncharacterized protein LOC111292580 isoform X10 [Durio zibethinus]